MGFKPERNWLGKIEERLVHGFSRGMIRSTHSLRLQDQAAPTPQILRVHDSKCGAPTVPPKRLDFLSRILDSDVWFRNEFGKRTHFVYIFWISRTKAAKFRVMLEDCDTGVEITSSPSVLLFLLQWLPRSWNCRWILAAALSLSSRSTRLKWISSCDGFVSLGAEIWMVGFV